MKKANAAEIEDIITARYRRDDPDIERIGIKVGPDGWRGHRVWLHEDVPRLSEEEIAAILDPANTILAELLKEYEIEENRRPSG